MCNTVLDCGIKAKVRRSGEDESREAYLAAISEYYKSRGAIEDIEIYNDLLRGLSHAST